MVFLIVLNQMPMLSINNNDWSEVPLPTIVSFEKLGSMEALRSGIAAHKFHRKREERGGLKEDFAGGWLSKPIDFCFYFS